MKTILSLATVILGLMVLSCEKTEEGIPTSNSAASTNGLTKSDSEIAPLDQRVKPMLQYCEDGRITVYRYYWENQDQYMPSTGKYIGMWDGDTSRQRINRHQYGFVMAIGGGTDVMDRYLSVGFSPGNIICALSNGAWVQEVDDAISRGISRFYIDEPIHKERRVLVTDAAPYVSGQGGTLTLSEYYEDGCRWYWLFQRGEISDMIDISQEAYPIAFVSCHSHFETTDPCPEIDPRDQWTYIMGRVPNAFKMAWIKVNSESVQHIGLLFGHATNIGINEIMLMPFDDSGNYIERRGDVAQQAWSHGWLHRLQKQVCQQWCCPTQSWDPEECTLQSSWYTGETRWY
jgi:hypothetical protein